MPRRSDILPVDRSPTMYKRAQEILDEFERAASEPGEAGGLERLLDELHGRLGPASKDAT